MTTGKKVETGEVHAWDGRRRARGEGKVGTGEGKAGTGKGKARTREAKAGDGEGKTTTG